MDDSLRDPVRGGKIAVPRLAHASMPTFCHVILAAVSNARLTCTYCECAWLFLTFIIIVGHQYIHVHRYGYKTRVVQTKSSAEFRLKNIISCILTYYSFVMPLLVIFCSCITVNPEETTSSATFQLDSETFGREFSRRPGNPAAMHEHPSS